MTKYISITIVLILLSGNFLMAQDQTILNVVYEFTYVRDLENKETPYKDNMILSLGKHQSRYCPEKLYNDNSLENIKKQQALQNIPTTSATTVVVGGPLLSINNSGALISEEVIKNFSDQKMSVNANVAFREYRIKSKIPQIKWEIKDDKKTIANYSCQNAIGSYGGRTYQVWFAPDLPFQDGPWKLSGLPGLILEANDDKNEVSFIAKEITKNTNPDETTRSYLESPYSIDTNLKAYNRVKTEFETDPEAVITARFPNAHLHIINIDDPDASIVKKIKAYNPMEIN